jgi:DNA-binding beta-propeller fold protein YncE
MSKMCRSNPMFAILACLRGRRRALALWLVAACLTPLLGATPASAVIAHPFLSSFNGKETPEGSIGLSALAVDNSAGQSAGDVYAAGGGAVDKFSAAPGSSYLCQITGAGSATSSNSECDGFGPRAPEAPFNGAGGVAVDPASGDVYIADTVHQVVDKFDAAGAYLSQITGFSYPTSLAVDASTGDLYIVDLETDEVKKYDPTSASLTTFTTGTPSGSFGAAYKVAVDNSTGASAGDVYILDASSHVVDKFDSSGKFLSQLSGTESGPFSDPFDLAVDPANGDLYVSDDAAGTVDQFDAAGNPVGQIVHGSMIPTAVALAANGDVYVANATGESSEHVVDVFGPGVVVPGVHTGEASSITATSATLEGIVNPAGLPVSDCHFDYVDEAHYNASLSNPYEAGSTAPCVPDAASLPADSEDHAVSADITGLTPGTTYHFRLQASNANGTGKGKDATLTTLPTPSIGEEAVAKLTAGSAELTATVDPNGFETDYHFEYDHAPYKPGEPAGAHGTSLGEATLPPGTGGVSVIQAISKLEADKTYHWRVVAESANGVTLGLDQTFVYDTSGEGLPDDRAYEMVTPSHKNGASLGSTFPQVASNGSRVIGKPIQCFAGAGSCSTQRGNGLGTSYEFSRTSSGWETTPLAPPASEFSSFTGWQSNAEAGTELFSSPTEPFGEDDLYGLRADGTITHIGPVTPPEKGPGAPSLVTWVVSPDLSHVVWTPWGFLSQHWPLDEAAGNKRTLYEYAGSENTEPFLVGVSGEDDPGSRDLISACGTEFVGHLGVGVMSADGRIVYFQADGGEGCVGTGSNAGVRVPANALYARVDGELPDAHTVAISEPSPGACTGACLASPPAGADFAGASSDGLKAFFLSTRRLTDQASEDSQSGDSASNGLLANGGCQKTTGENGCNLYEYDFTRPPGDRTVAVSAGDTSGHGPRVQGVVAVSGDGSHVYFVAQGVLTQAANAQGQIAQDRANNLYVYESGAGGSAGQLRFIAALPDSDTVEWGSEAVTSANVTPDGRYLVFTSSGRLTADDSSVSGARQVFRYDSQTGELLRVSIGEDGFDNNGNRTTPDTCGAVHCSEDAMIATLRDPMERRDPTMSDDGSYVFFQSSVALTPHALHDVRVATAEGLPSYAQNVYEWHAGHVYLISDGRDVTASQDTIGLCFSLSSVCLLGSDATGANVFFATADQLTAADSNSEVDYYDARVCEPDAGNPCIAPPASPAPTCSGEACHGTPAATAVAPDAPTVSFSGLGNVARPATPAGKTAKSLPRGQKLARALEACHRKHDRRRRATCERVARKRYGPSRRARKQNYTKSSRNRGGK